MIGRKKEKKKKAARAASKRGTSEKVRFQMSQW
jgi:hypothetical protein